MLTKKKVLGRGLSALIQTEEKAETKYFLCPIDEISPGIMQPRKDFSEAQLIELADSIREKGVIEPLIVRKTETGYELIAGERRLRASKLAGLKEVPVVLREATDEDSLELAIIENVQREGLNPVEEADAYRKLMERFNLSQDEVAIKVGKDRATVANYLRLLKLPHEVVDELKKGAISMGHAKALLSIEGHAAQREACAKILQKGLSVRESEALAKQFSATVNKDRTIIPKKSEHVKSVEDELRSRFGTKIVVKDRKGKGRIEIEYYSYEELERLLDILRK